MTGEQNAPPEIEEVLAEHRGQAAVLRHNGHRLQAESIERVCEDVSAALAAYLDWLTEEEAQLASGWSVTRLRRAFPGWEAIGMAKLEGVGRRARRRYRRIIVPQRPQAFAAYAAGRRRSA